MAVLFMLYALRSRAAAIALSASAILFNSLVLVHSARRYALRRRDKREGRCPVCHYSLVDLPDAVPRGTIGRILGPRRCPECGEPWPRVPDPA